MGDLMGKEKILDKIFYQHDIYNTGGLCPDQLQLMHSDLRVGGISIPQIEASIKYTCTGTTCERSELFYVLQEMDRRYFLIQNLRWEFSLLHTACNDTIAVDEARWFMEMVHGEYFCQMKWEHFLRSRSMPGSGVYFTEIEVILCDIPSREEWLADQQEALWEKQDLEQEQQELDHLIEVERSKRNTQRDEDRRWRDYETDRRRLEDRQRLEEEEEEERHQRQRDKDNVHHQRRKLEEDEEHVRGEVEEREKQEKQRQARQRKEKEEVELEHLRKLADQQQYQDEQLHRQELCEVLDYENVLKETMQKEFEAEQDMEHHQRRMVEAGDDITRKKAAEDEHEAKLRKKEYRNKRVRYNLKVAIKKRDLNILPKAVSEFKKAKLTDDDNDLPKAEQIMSEHQVRQDLVKATKARQLKPLEQAIAYVWHNGFEVQLQKQMIEAHKVLLQLRRLDRIRAEILELKQSTVAEIRSYQKPPPVVHVIMTGTFLLLGHKEKETKDWKTVQALVGKTGKEGLKRRCLECEPIKIPEDMANRAKQLIAGHELDEIRDVSAGAATFFLWSWTMIEEGEAQHEARKQEEEEQKHLKEEKRQTREKILDENPTAVFIDDEKTTRKSHVDKGKATNSVTGKSQSKTSDRDSFKVITSSKHSQESRF